MKLQQKAASFSALTVLLLLLVGMINSRPSIPITAYSPLLDVIATAESKGNYNAYFSNAANKEINFTAMPIRDVIAWQEAFVKNGNPSSAVGKYQIIQPTLEGLVTELNISPDTHFDAATQDKLAVALIERRGSVAFIENKLTAAEFAHNLSKEWAALPRIIGNAPESSYYAGDGLNASLVDSKTSLNAVEQFKLRGQK
jgi:conjugal transfer mating pair stabilization protein TraG